jgi:hypothetical protein
VLSAGSLAAAQAAALGLCRQHHHIHRQAGSKKRFIHFIIFFKRAQGAPASGWTGFLVQVDYLIPVPGLGNVSWRVSTEVNVVPDTFPFRACPASECNSPPRI